MEDYMNTVCYIVEQEEDVCECICSCSKQFSANPFTEENMELLYNSKEMRRQLTPVCPKCKSMMEM